MVNPNQILQTNKQMLKVFIDICSDSAGLAWDSWVNPKPNSENY